jgi:hypothetical protein
LDLSAVIVFNIKLKYLYMGPGHEIALLRDPTVILSIPEDGSKNPFQKLHFFLLKTKMIN